MDTTKKIGRYEILEELGHGAMGTVYRAKDPAMDRVVAVKTIISMALASEQGAEFRERFQREARAAGALSHPGIVAVFDVGEHEDMPYLVMEFVDGRTLADAVERGERLSLDRVCEIGQKVAEALGYAHQRGVVHRDIKPANILLTSRETHGIERPKITDFGVAKLAEGQTTLTGQIRGTPAFMSPEQFTGAPVDGRADIFSLGVVLYWMATGEQPFPGKNMTAVFYKIVHTEPVPPRKLNPSLPVKLESVILKCLAKDPAERYQSGEELARELGGLRASTSSAVGPENTAPRAAAQGSDPDATILDAASATVAHATMIPPVQPRAAAPEKKAKGRWILAAIVVVVLLGGGWYILRSRGESTAQEKALSAASAPTTTVPPTGAPPATAVAVPAKPSPGPRVATPKLAATPSAPDKPTKKPATKAPAGSEAALAKAGAEATAPAAVGFNPRTLDPKQNAKLRIDLEQMPQEINFVVEMNGQTYLEHAASEANAREQDLFVPPGVQEFRVVAKAGPVQKISNTVSAEFRAKKKNTLKIELRTQGMPPGSGVPQGLYPNTQIVLTLK